LFFEMSPKDGSERVLTVCFFDGGLTDGMQRLERYF